MMSDEKQVIDQMMPREKEIYILGQAYMISPFKVSDLVFFSREIQDALVSIKKNNPDMEFTEKNTSILVPLLIQESERLLGLFARALNKDKKWLEDNVDMAGLSELILAVTEVNNFGVIISNFIKAWSLLKKQKVQTSGVA